MWSWKRKFTRALPLAKLDPSSSEGNNYVIQNVDSGQKHLLVLTKLEGSLLGIAKWKGKFETDKIFKIEGCTDNSGETCIVGAYGPHPRPQWVLSNDGKELEMKVYPVPGTGGRDDERLRPPSRRWRFKFDLAEPTDLKRYRIMCMEDELVEQETNYLRLSSKDVHGMRHLEFVELDESDLSQLWCLHQR